jgi:hypothetical protein
LARAGRVLKLIPATLPINFLEDLKSVKEKAPVVKQLYRLNVEPKVVDQLTKLASRTKEPKSRLATRLFTEAVMGMNVPSPLKGRGLGRGAGKKTKT